MNNRRSLFAVRVALCSMVLGLAPWPISQVAEADIIYANTGSSPGGVLIISNNESNTPWTTWGDHVTFGPGPRNIRSGRVELYAAGQSGGNQTFDVALLVYEDNAGTVGSLLTSSTVFSVTLQNQVRTWVSVPSMNATVGNSAFVGIALRGHFVGGDIGDAVGGALWNNVNPTIGSSSTTTMVAEIEGFGIPFGTSATDYTGFGYENLRFELSAIPEPSMLAPLFAFGLACTAFALRRRNRRDPNTN